MFTTTKSAAASSAVLTATQVAVQSADIPLKYRLIALGVQILFETLSKFLAFHKNPDGTPAAVAYVKEK